eukprot:3979967-Alexandrium_andersonii.AAC.1
MRGRADSCGWPEQGLSRDQPSVGRFRGRDQFALRGRPFPELGRAAERAVFGSRARLQSFSG